MRTPTTPRRREGRYRFAGGRLSVLLLMQPLVQPATPPKNHRTHCQTSRQTVGRPKPFSAEPFSETPAGSWPAPRADKAESMRGRPQHSMFKGWLSICDAQHGTLRHARPVPRPRHRAPRADRAPAGRPARCRTPVAARRARARQGVAERFPLTGPRALRASGGTHVRAPASVPRHRLAVAHQKPAAHARCRESRVSPAASGTAQGASRTPARPRRRSRQRSPTRSIAPPHPRPAIAQDEPPASGTRSDTPADTPPRPLFENHRGARRCPQSKFLKGWLSIIKASPAIERHARPGPLPALAPAAARTPPAATPA